MSLPNEFEIHELETGTYTATITGNDGVTPVPAASLTSIVLTLYAIIQAGTVSYVNARDHLNVLNLNNVTIDGSGLLTWSIQVADTTLIEAIPFERHIALFEWVTTSGARGEHEVILVVKNLVEAEV